jgi:hypothetical protein
MSAWIVSKAHIDVLVQALINEGVIENSAKTADYVGGQLWTENHRSVNIRYGEVNKRPPYRWSPIYGPDHQPCELDDAVVLRSIACYHYQCMEWEGFDRQPGMRKLMKLKAELIAKHGIQPFTDDCGNRDDGVHRWCDENYDGRLPWGIDNRRQAIKHEVEV